MSRYVKVLAPIQPTNPETGEPLVISQRAPSGQTMGVKVLPQTQMGFILGAVAESPKLGKGFELADRVYRLRQAFVDLSLRCQIGAFDYFTFEDSDWKAVADALEDFQPSNAILWAEMRPFLQEWKPEQRQDEEWKRKQAVKLVDAEDKGQVKK